MAEDIALAEFSLDSIYVTIVFYDSEIENLKREFGSVSSPTCRKILLESVDGYAVHILEMPFKRLLTSFEATSPVWMQYRRTFHKTTSLGDVVNVDVLNILEEHLTPRIMESTNFTIERTKFASKGLSQLVDSATDCVLKGSPVLLNGTNIKDVRRITEAFFDCKKNISDEMEKAFYDKILISETRFVTASFSSTETGECNVNFAAVQTLYVADMNYCGSETANERHKRKFLEKRFFYFDVNSLRKRVTDGFLGCNNETYQCAFILFLQMMRGDERSMKDSIGGTTGLELTLLTKSLLTIMGYLGAKS
jgi:hypothetical protein